MRVLSIDLGDARTGLALGDRVTRLAAPAALIETPIDRAGGDALIRDIARQALDILGGDLSAGRAEVVMGLPVNMDGTEGPRAKGVRAYAARVAAALGVPIVLVDERRSTVAADERLARTGLTHKQKKQRRDAIAAATILQGYLDDPGCALGRVEVGPDRG